MFETLNPARRASIAESIRKIGFRRWHERQLIEAHASLVTSFLALIVVLVSVDQFGGDDAGTKPLLNLALIAVGLVLCFKGAMFYLRVLSRAERLAAQAVCSACQTYGRIEVLAESDPTLHGAAAEKRDDWFKVRCRKCAHGWTISATPS